MNEVNGHKNGLPEKWEWKKLGDICDKVTKGGTPTTYGFAFVDEGINFIKVENIENGKVDLKSIKTFISTEAHNYQKKSQLEENDLLFSIAGTIGETCLITKDYLPANTNQALAILRGYNKNLSPKFLTLQLNSTVAQIVKSKARGGAMNNISLEDLKQIDLVVPPKIEQDAITYKIEELFSELDKGIEQLKTAQQQLKVYRQSVLKWAFEGQLIEIESNWVVKKFKDCLLFSQGIQVDVKKQSLSKDSNLTRFLRIVDFTQGNETPRFIDDPGERYKVDVSDVSLVRYGASNGFVCTGLEVAIANNLFKVTPTEKISKKFLFYFLNSLFFQNVISQKIKGAAMPAISFGLINDISIPIPTIHEQHKIVQEIDSRLSAADKLEETITDSLQQAEVLRQSILKKAFEGKLVSN
jgi:restriction endonuclease S subunit